MEEPPGICDEKEEEDNSDVGDDEDDDEDSSNEIDGELNEEIDGDEHTEIDEEDNGETLEGEENHGCTNGVEYDENDTDGNGFSSDATMPNGGHQCPGCSARYEDFMEYLLHSKSCPLNTVTEPVHQVRTAKHARRFPCNTCDKVFTTKSNAYRHMKQHLNNTAKPRVIHECHLCFKKFTNRKVLAKHLKTHGGDVRSYRCELCDAAFAHSSNLKKHMKRKHPDENIIVDIPTVTKAQVSNNFGAISMVDFKTANGYVDDQRQNGNEISSASPSSPSQDPNTELEDFNNDDDNPLDIPRSDILGMSYHSPVSGSPGLLKKKKICPICGKGFSTSGNLSRHKKIHNGSKPHQCNHCDRKFLEKNDLKRHLKTHDLKDVSAEVMDSGKIATTSDVLVKSDDLANLTSFVDLNKSGDLIKSSGLLHLDEQEQFESTPVVALPHNEAGNLAKSFNAESTELSESMEINEQLNQLTSISLSIDNTPEFEPDQNEELAGIGVRIPRKIHKCRVCRKEFLYRSNYLTHMRIHSAEKPFKCNICSSRFTQSSNLYRHMKLHKSGKPIRLKSTNVIRDDEFLAPEAYANGENELDFEEEEARAVLEQVNKGPSRICNICGKQFSTEGNLARHMQIHVGEKPFTCKFCPQSFLQSVDLKHHLRIHIQENINPASDPLTGENRNTIVRSTSPDYGYGQFKVQDQESHQCTICNKELSTEGNLKRHMKIHSGSRPYQCQHCHRTFESEVELERHARIHSRNETLETRTLDFSRNNGMTESWSKNNSTDLDDDLEQGNDLQAFMRSQTPKLQFFASRELPTMSSSPLTPVMISENRGQIEMVGKRALKRSQLDQLMNVEVEDEPKVLIIHNNDDFDLGPVSPSENNKGFPVHTNNPNKNNYIVNMDEKQMKYGTNPNTNNLKPNVPSLDVMVDENFDDYNGKEEPEMWFMEKSEPPAQLLSGRELREKYFSKKPSHLLPAHVDEPVAMSSAPRPPDDNVVQPVFVYKNKDLENSLDDDIIVVNTSQVCNICAEHFSTEEELRKHMILHENGMLDEANALNLHMCKICGKKFSTDGNLNRHMKIHTGEKPFQCGSCGRQFTQSNDLKRHLKIHMRPDGVEGSTCTGESHTGDGSRSPRTLQLSVEGGENAIYACGTCGKRYSSFPNLKRHLKLHAGLQASQYEVIDMKDSGAMYGDPDTLVDEYSAKQLSSTSMKPGAEYSPSKNNEKYFLCKLCQKSYTSLGNLKRHIEVNHGANGSQSNDVDESLMGTTDDADDPSFECYEAPQDHSSSVQTSPPFSIVQDNGRRFVCRVCGKHYSTVKSLNRHLKLHAGMKMSEYEIIGRDSPPDLDDSGDNTLQDNLQSIEGISRVDESGKIFVCKVCGKSYSTLGNLKRHLKLNHSDFMSSDNEISTPENRSEDGSEDSLLYIDEGNVLNKEGDISHSAVNQIPQPTMTLNHMNINKYAMVVNPSEIQSRGGGRIQNSRFSMKNYKSTAKTTWCKLCGKSYFNISNLKRHMKIVHTGVDIAALVKSNEKPIQPNSKGLELNLDLSIPAPNSYNSTGIFDCYICQRTFSSDAKLKSHMHLHGDMNTEQQADKLVITDSSVSIHSVDGSQTDNLVNRLNDNPEDNHDNSQCSNLKDNNSDYHSEIPKVNTPKDNLENGESSKDESSLLCHVCGKSYSCHGNLKIHMKLNHNLVDDSPQPNKTTKLKPLNIPPSLPSPPSPSEKKFICNVCSKPFSSILKLKRHLRLHPGFKVCQYSSDGTGNELDTESSSITMANTLSQLNKTPSTNADLNDISEGATLCHICGKQYSTVGNLKRHMKLNHPGNEEEEITHCVICGRDYASVGNLKRHMKLNHSNNLEETARKKFTCQVCGQQFTTHENLKHHIELQHHGNTERSVEHDQDDSVTLGEDTDQKKLSRTPSLEDLEHIQTANLASLVAPNEIPSDTDGMDMRKAGSREPCSCPVCGKPYSTPGNLRRHMKLHMGMNTSQYKVVERQSYASFVDYDESGKSLVETLQSLDPNSNPITMEDYNNSMGKSFACTVCGKNYMCLGNLKRHLDSTSCGINNPQCDKEPIVKDMDIEQSKENINDYSLTNNAGMIGDVSGSSMNKIDLADADNRLEWTIDETYDPDDMNQANTVENLMSNDKDEATTMKDAPISDPVTTRLWREMNHLHNGMDIEDDANNTDNEDIDESMISIDIKTDCVTDGAIEFTHAKNRNEDNDKDRDTISKSEIPKSKITNLSSNLNGGCIHTCPICSQQYTTFEFLQCHMATHTTNRKSETHHKALRVKLKPKTGDTADDLGTTVSRNLRPHICPICHKEFSTGSNMSRHMKIHSGVKPYQCKGCERYFTQSNDLKRHIKTHCPESDPTLSETAAK